MKTEQAISQLESIQRYKGLVNQKQGAQCELYPKDFPAIDLALEALQEKHQRENPKPLTNEQLRERIGKPIWCELNGQYGVLGIKKVNEILTRGVVGFSYGWEWLSDMQQSDIYDHEPKEEGER